MSRDMPSMIQSMIQSRIVTPKAFDASEAFFSTGNSGIDRLQDTPGRQVCKSESIRSQVCRPEPLRKHREVHPLRRFAGCRIDSARNRHPIHF